MNTEVERLNQLGRVFLAVDSPGQLADYMAEGGAILASLVLRKSLVFNDMVFEMAQTARNAAQRPVPLWDSSVSDFAYRELFAYVADEYSDRPKSILHIEKQQGSSVWMATNRAKDYKHQALRYSVFCAEVASWVAKEPDNEKQTPTKEPQTQFNLTAEDYSRMLKIANDIRLDKQLETEGKVKRHPDRRKVYNRCATAKSKQSENAKGGKPNLYLMAEECVNANLNVQSVDDHPQP